MEVGYFGPGAGKADITATWPTKTTHDFAVKIPLEALESDERTVLDRLTRARRRSRPLIVAE